MVHVEVCQQCPEEYAAVGVEVESSEELLLACSEALCTSRVGGSEDSQSWFLETCRGL